MSFDEVLSKRRSIRKYTDDEVKKSDLEKIIDAAILAPSAHNRQPWKIKILTKEQKNQVAESLLKIENDPSIPVTSRVIQESPLLLAIFLNNDNKEEREDDLLSIGAFIEHLILKATDLEYGSLWIANTSKIKEEIKQITKTNLECISTVVIGKKNQNPNPRPRKTKDEIIIQ